MARFHRSVKGRQINMEELRNVHGTQRAIGNASLNARGDVLNEKGEIIRLRSDIVKDYNNSNPAAVKHVSLKDRISSIPVMQPDELTDTLNKMRNEKNETEKKTRKLKEE